MPSSAPASPTPPPWPTCQSKTPPPPSSQNWAPWTFLFNLTRQPALSLPMGVNAEGLPVAVQIAAPLYRDDIVLRVARTVEREM